MRYCCCHSVITCVTLCHCTSVHTAAEKYIMKKKMCVWVQLCQSFRKKNLVEGAARREERGTKSKMCFTHHHSGLSPLTGLLISLCMMTDNETIPSSFDSSSTSCCLVNEKKLSVIQLLPCNIHHDGPAPIQNYFQTRQIGKDQTSNK
jgi:hypothetical protein